MSVTTTKTIRRCRIIRGLGPVLRPAEVGRPVPDLAPGRPFVRAPERVVLRCGPGRAPLCGAGGRGACGLGVCGLGVWAPSARRGGTCRSVGVRRSAPSAGPPPARGAARGAALGESLSLPGGDLLEPHGQLERRGAVLGVLRETGPHQWRQGVVHVVQMRLLVHHPVEHHLGTAVPERRVGRRGVRECGAQREDVGRRGDRGAAHLLGREEAR